MRLSLFVATAWLVPAAVLVQPAPSQATTGATVIYSNVPGYAVSAVPGLPGVSFDPGTGSSDFDRVYGSPNGNWILTAFADLPSGEDELLIVNGVLVQQEGTPAPWTGGTQSCGPIDRRCSINAAGDFVFTTNTNGASSADEYVVTFIGGVWNSYAREGDPIPQLPGNSFGATLASVLLLDDGTVGFVADMITGVVTSTEDELLVLGSNVLMQEGVTVPPGQSAASMEAMETFDQGKFWTTPSGSHWMVEGDLEGDSSTDDVVVVDGTVVLQQGFHVPGAGFADPINNIEDVHMAPNGDWYARGDNMTTRDDWIVRNGSVVATTGGPIHVGAMEAWDDATFSSGFFLHVGNSLGDYVIGGSTNQPDPMLDRVLVFNGARVICRKSDPLDLDGNGLFDDGAFVDTFDTDGCFLSDDGLVFILMTIKDSTDSPIGQCFVQIDTTRNLGFPYCAAQPNSSGSVGEMAATGTANVVAGDVRLEAYELPFNSFGFFLTSRLRGFVANPAGSQGNLCLSGPIGRFVGPGQIQNTYTTGRMRLSIDLASIPQPTGFVGIQAGETWRYQAWHRDFVAGAATSNFTDGLEIFYQ